MPPSNDDLAQVVFTAPANRDVDVLFVVDTAPGSAGAQAKLAAAFPAFVATLMAGRARLPNLHVAVISSDLGAGADTATDVPGCRPGGDRGVFQVAPRLACPAAGLPARDHFISVVDGVANLSGGLADALACVAPLGEAGCAFRQPFAAALRALGADGAPAPAENAGFLRAGAFLSVVFLTGDDDCSAPATFFDPTSRRIDDPLGPLTTFRCAEFGLRCGGVAPSRTMAGALAGCASAEDGELSSFADVVARLKALKTNRNSVLVAALAAPPTPFTVELAAAPTDDPHPWPRVAPSCQDTARGTVARPGVRMEQLVYAFGHNGVIESVCDDDFAPSMSAIAQSLSDVLGPPCLDAPIAPTTGPHGARADCAITRFADDGGAGVPVPACLDDGDVAPCWTLATDAACPRGKLLSFETTTAEPDVARTSAVACRVCASATDPRCR
ncbi:MAG: hypothetical protein JWM82_466 [Myxococcales bacterium]|nr:hypothetical protein [Myxococcales bacterium]